MRNRLDPEREQALLAFWERRAGFAGEPARKRLPEVVCLLRAGEEVVGASSVFAANLEHIGRRRFWIYRSLLDESHEREHHALIAATFKALEAERPAGDDAPEGLCVLLDSEQQRACPPEAEWTDPRMIYAGYLTDGRQIRLAYFSDQISRMTRDPPGGVWRPTGGYRIERFGQQDEVSADEVIDTWVTEGGLSRQEAERRIDELLLLGIAPDGRLAAITTAYLAENQQLHADFWYFRAFVKEQHRLSDLAVALAVAGRERLIERFVSGEDSRGLGFIFEVENEGLKRAFPKGFWYESDVILIAENEQRAHVRVHYFPGVLAPEPQRRAAA